MSLVIRDTFIELHQSNVLEKLEEEFRTRYADYKVPLSGLRSGNFLNNLFSAGLKLKMTAAQAAQVGVRMEDNRLKRASTTDIDHDLTDNVVVVNDEGKSTDGLDDMLNLLATVSNGSKKATKKKRTDSLFDMDPDLLKEGKDLGEDDEDTDKKITAKFINVTDLFPPLPPKGTFDVEDIKKSQYFFS